MADNTSSRRIGRGMRQAAPPQLTEEDMIDRINEILDELPEDLGDKILAYNDEDAHSVADTYGLATSIWSALSSRGSDETSGYIDDSGLEGLLPLLGKLAGRPVHPDEFADLDALLTEIAPRVDLALKLLDNFGAIYPLIRGYKLFGVKRTAKQGVKDLVNDTNVNDVNAALTSYMAGAGGLWEQYFGTPAQQTVSSQPEAPILPHEPSAQSDFRPALPPQGVNAGWTSGSPSDRSGRQAPPAPVRPLRGVSAARPPHEDGSGQPIRRSGGQPRRQRRSGGQPPRQ